MLVVLKGLLVSVIGLVAAMALGGLALAQEPTPTAPHPGLNVCPTGYTLTVSPPSASAPNTVSVAVSPQPENILPVAGDSWVYFTYFVDTDPTPAGQQIPGEKIPIGGRKIIHQVDQYFGAPNITRDLTQAFFQGTPLEYAGGALSAGRHTVWVVLGTEGGSLLPSQACDLRGSVTFTVAAAVPSAAALPSAGSASASSGDSTGLWAALAAVAGAVMLAGGLALRRRA